jgi:gliding motility-associated-like protein
LNAAISGEDAGGAWTNSGLIYTYTVSATAPCTGTDTSIVTVTLQAAPVAGKTTNFSIVVGGSVTLELLNAHISGNQLGTWNATSGGAGTYTYTVAATSPCSEPAIINVVVTEQAPPNPGIFHTTVTSSDFINGATNQLIEQLCYTTKNGKVTNVTPGQMFYYTAIKAPSDDFYIDIEETKSEAGLALFEITQKNQIRLWDTYNNKVADGTQTSIGKGQIHISNAVMGAQYVLSVKYDSKSIIGSSFSGTAPICTYKFVSKINGIIVSRTSVDMTPNCPIVSGALNVVVKEQARPNLGIFHTTVTSSDFINGATDQLIEQLCYTTKNGKVTNVTPSQMFYYTAIKAPSDDFYIDVEETKSESGLALFEITQKNQISLWDTDKNKVADGTQTSIGKGQIHISNAVMGAQYVLSVKYDSKFIIGSSFSGTAPICTYKFVSKINGTIVSSTSVEMTPDCPIVLGALECVIEVFNAISPNGDGSNDFFRIEGLNCYPDNRVEIYNRWGVLVFERTGYNNNDRVFRGLSEGRVTIKPSEELPTGTYFYIIKYNDTDSKGREKSGYLYLNR